MLKQANLSFSVAAQSFGDDVTAIQFSTLDRNTAKLVFTIKNGKEPLNLTDVEAKVDLVMGDKSIFEDNKAKVTAPLDGKLEYTITPEQIRHPGRARGELQLTSKDGQSIGGFRFNFTVKKALVDEMAGPVKEYYVQDLEAIKAEIRKTADSIKDLDVVRIDTKLNELEQKVEEGGVGVDEQARQGIEGLTEQLADKANNNTQLLNRLLVGEVTKIKLIGDSVTAGAQSKGYGVPTNGRVILTNSRFNEGGTGYARETATDWNTFPSWANLFRKYIKTNYPSIDFFNAGITGLALEEVMNDYLTQIIRDDEDVVFIMLGLNDRSEPLETYEERMRDLIDYVKERSSLVILMSPPPTTSEYVDNEPSKGLLEDRHFGSREIDNTLRKLSEEYNLPFISHFISSSDYLSKTSKPFKGDEGINADNTHPTTLGYKVMWQTIQRELKFANDITEWAGNGYKEVKFLNFDSVVNSTPLSFFAAKSVTYCAITNINPEKALFPEDRGMLVTVKAEDNVPYFSYQQFFAYLTQKSYIRYWDSGKNVWKAWKEDTLLLVKYRYEIVSPSTPLTSNEFENENVTYHAIHTNYAANFPEGTNGVLKTVKPLSALLNLGYQEYKTNNRVYLRSWTGSAWGAWKLITSNLSLTTPERTALEPHIDAGVSVFDKTLNKPVWRNAANNGWVDATGTTV